MHLHPTPEHLRVLLVKESEASAAPILSELERSGREVVTGRVQTADEMAGALISANWDVVVSDWELGAFSAAAAMKVLHASGNDLPFIVVTHSVGEDVAVSALRQGADDFLVDGRLERLLPAIDRARREVEQRHAHRRAQQALRASEARFRSLVEHAVFGIFQVSIDGQFLSVNPAMVAMLGYDSADELLRTSAADVYVDREVRDDIRRQCLESGTVSAEALWHKKDGSVIRVRVNGRVSRDRLSGQPVFEVIVEDITAQQLLQEQLRQSQRMEVIGQLAGGVAHDFNNMLTAILGYSELLTEQIGPDKPIGQDLLQIKAAAERAAALTRHLLAFSRKQVLSMTTLDLSEVVRSLAPVFRRLLGERITIVTALADDLVAVMGDATQLEHALVNLCVNARDAMPDGGLLRIGTHNVRIDERYVREHPGCVAGDYAALTVSDTGTGISPEIQGRIFEPFFTTKEVGRGTGLGLSAVFGTVKQLHGYIEVSSQVGSGTTFTLYLPRTDQMHVARQRPVAVGTPVGIETILLVEDEAGVRSFVKMVLQRFGYQVIEADTGETAVAALERLEGSIDLLLVDVVLPGIDGPQLAERLLAVRPNIPVLYMSGYADRLTQIEGVLAPGVQLLVKPFTAQALLTKVRDLLGSVQLDVA